jgi:flagellar biosynthesis protein FlhF
MQTRIFTGPDRDAAVARLRAELGEDAIILDIDAPPGGPARVVAAPGAPRPADASAAEPGRAQVARSALATLLARHNVPAGLAARMLRSEFAGDRLATSLPAALAANLEFARLPVGAAASRILVAGPAGAGKTATCAKLAARILLAGGQPCLASTDDWRVGGAEQLRRYAEALGCAVEEATKPQDLVALASRLPAGTALVVDTPGIDPAHAAEIDALAGWSAALRVAPILVLPAGLDADEAADTALGFAALGATTLVASRVDAARRLGGILSAADAASLALAAAGNSPRIADGLVDLDAQALADMMSARST